MKKADRGWYVVYLHCSIATNEVIIRDIVQVTHWKDGRPYNNVKARTLGFDPDVNCIGHVTDLSFLMNPQGRLLGWANKLVANSIYEIHEKFVSVRAINFGGSKCQKE